LKAKWVSVIGAVQMTAVSWAGAEPAVQAGLPELTEARVTIPYTELRALWEAGRARQDEGKEPPEEPPVGHLWHRIDCVLTFAGDGRAGTLEATFDGEVLAKGWQGMFLLDGGLSLEQADAGANAVVWRDGYR